MEVKEECKKKKKRNGIKKNIYVDLWMKNKKNRKGEIR